MPPLTLLLNLRSRPDRRAAALTRARAAGLEPEVFSAIQPADLASRSWSYDSALPPTVAACTASHISMAAQVVERGVPWALLLEDDVTFEADFLPRLQAAMEALPLGWDLLQVGWLPRPEDLAFQAKAQRRIAANRPLRKLAHLVKPRTPVEPPPVQQMLPSYGMHCYAISARFANHMAALDGSRIFAPADFLVRYLPECIDPLTPFRCRFPLAGQDWSFGSDVDPIRFAGGGTQYDSAGRTLTRPSRSHDPEP